MMTQQDNLQGYYVHLENRFQPVEGESIVIPGLEGFDLFVHEALTYGGWNVSEGITGALIVGAFPSRDIAISRAIEFLSSIPADQFHRRLIRTITQSGISPRHPELQPAGALEEELC